MLDSLLQMCSVWGAPYMCLWRNQTEVNDTDKLRKKSKRTKKNIIQGKSHRIKDTSLHLSEHNRKEIMNT